MSWKFAIDELQKRILCTPYFVRFFIYKKGAVLQSTDPIGGTPIGGILRFVEKFYTDPIGGTSKMVNGQVVYGQILSHFQPLLDFKCSLFSH